MEGLGIPPIEAAIAGNKVIGYTGKGGNEYWNNPIFTEIAHGDISGFIKNKGAHFLFYKGAPSVTPVTRSS